jgi:ATP phosphoribosyltransferase
MGLTEVYGERLTLALPKGRLLEPAVALLARLGYDASALGNGSRKLILDDAAGALRYILAKPDDVPVYVEYGVADLGIVGQDVLREREPDVYEPLLLGFGRCRLVLAAPRERAHLNLRLEPVLRVATKYPRLTSLHFQRRGIAVEIVRLSGSVELAPATGLASLLVDVVDTGRTLRENGLVEIEMLLHSEATLIANRAAFKLRMAEIEAFVQRMARAVREMTEGGGHA